MFKQNHTQFWQVWELIGKYISQFPLDSLLAFRQSCKTARKLVDNLPDFCEDISINLGPHNFHRFMIINETPLPLHNFRLRNLTHLSKFPSFFPAFTFAWAERITTLHLRTIHLDSNFLVAAFLSSLTTVHHLKIDKIETCAKNTLTTLPLSLFANLHNLNIRKWNAGYHFIDLGNDQPSNSQSASRTLRVGELEKTPKFEPKPEEKLSLMSIRNYTLNEFCSQLFQTLNENDKLSHLSLNLRNIPIEYMTSLIRSKKDTPMTFQLLCDEEVKGLLDEGFIGEVSSSNGKVQMVDTKAPAGIDQFDLFNALNMLRIMIPFVHSVT